MKLNFTCPKCGFTFRAESVDDCPKCAMSEADQTLAWRKFSQEIGAVDSSETHTGGGRHVESESYYPDHKSFMSVLFNFRFEDFIYIRVASTLFLIALVVGGVALIAVESATVANLVMEYSNANKYDAVASYMAQKGWTHILLMFVWPFAYLFGVIALRLTLESGVALIRIAENTERD